MSTINPNTPNFNRDLNRPAARGGGPSGWTWIIVALVIVVILWIVFGSRGSNRTMANPANGNNTTSQPNGAPAANAEVTNVQQLADGDTKDLVGKSVALPAAIVSDPVSSNAVLIEAGGKQLLVVNATAVTGPQGGTAENNGGAGQGANGETARNETGAENSASARQEQTAAIKKGDTVAVQGTIEKMPSEHDAMKQFNLSSDEAARLGNNNVYIRASSIQPAAK